VENMDRYNKGTRQRGKEWRKFSYLNAQRAAMMTAKFVEDLSKNAKPESRKPLCRCRQLERNMRVTR
jgi:hypothetical protein